MDLAEIYETYVSRIYNYIFYRVLHKEIAEDLVSTIFLKAAENLGSYDPERGAVITWLYTIAENTLRDYFRSPRAVPISLDDLSDDERLSVDFEQQSMLIRNEQRRELYLALTELDEPTRDIISQKYFLEKPIRQIAQEREMNENTAYTLHRRGVEKLREKIGVSMDRG